MSEQKLLTEAELLEALNIDVDRTTVWHWRKRGLPHVKVGRAIRYELSAVRPWLAANAVDSGGPKWDWSVWSWVPAERRGEVEEPAFWYEECRCRNQVDAEKIRDLFSRAHPGIHYRVGQSKPADPPDEGNPASERRD